ncbi:isochorismatase [Gallibacterium salpingitidis]|uniref:Isochorismatase n=1 Tax=Gallibacterium salpingitidis TaxID=505341 RepID=A0A1A7P1H9_9PAST|nr:cysteine hydrolase family protein [Gallibacterium salpingitidis]OBW96302.1 isochorismatase [Gallibacterium salpingitidis]OBX07941.1 isochorismatase [Gallibacterium salpingitidis]OBX11466.1 isochorismatase [Gallibacterium salpingitidis]
MIEQSKPALILIDIQQGFDIPNYWGRERNNPMAEEQAALLLQQWRQKGYPIFHIQHSSQLATSCLHPSHAGHAFKPIVQPQANETIIQKTVNSAFIGTDLKQRLDEQNIKQLVIVGLTTDHCVSTTTRMAGNYGYQVFLVADATATFNRIGINGEDFSAELIHQTALASLNGEFAMVVTTAEMLASIK